MAETFIPRSTNIAEVTYDGDTKTLSVTFKDGDQWEYSGVPAEVYGAFQRAPSAGSFFYRNMRGRYPETQV